MDQATLQAKHAALSPVLTERSRPLQICGEVAERLKAAVC
jgi:hypothetical protein